MEGRDAVIDVDLPEGAEGDAVIRADGKLGGTLIRPYLDRDAVRGRDRATGRGAGRQSGDASTRKMKIRAFIVGGDRCARGLAGAGVDPDP